MNQFAFLLLTLLIIHFSIQSTEADDYSGAVGKLKAEFSLDFHDDGSVSGTYSYPSRKGTVYRLSGSNPRQGELYLEEYTGTALSAKCYLSKRISEGAIVWEGVMKNTDGREFNMVISRTRDAVSKPIADAGENVYTGNVGKLTAEYFLEWGENGSISGTYHYPSRPGKTYRLEGSSPREGILLLDEYTGSSLSAKCTLEKRFANGRIVWEGVMKNTDGRQFEMRLEKQAAGSEPSLVSAGDYETPDWYPQVKPQEFWDTFPKANENVEMVPIHFPDGYSVSAKVTRYQSKDGKIEMDYVLGKRNQKKFDDVRFDGPKVLFHALSELILPDDVMVGKEIFLNYDRSGNLLSLGLHAIAVTHVRKTPYGKLETRGILATKAVKNLNGTDLTAMQKVIESTPSVAFIPDKMALLDSPVEELYFQDLRIVRDYGICIQSTTAGPGILELEAISLDPPSNEQTWIFIGGKNGWDMIPLSQRTGEAG